MMNAPPWRNSTAFEEPVGLRPVAPGGTKFPACASANLDRGEKARGGEAGDENERVNFMLRSVVGHDIVLAHLLNAIGRDVHVLLGQCAIVGVVEEDALQPIG